MQCSITQRRDVSKLRMQQERLVYMQSWVDTYCTTRFCLDVDLHPETARSVCDKLFFLCDLCLISDHSKSAARLGEL